MSVVLFEEFNPAAVDAALETGPFHPRITVHIQHAGTVYRFVRDTDDRTVDGTTFAALPFLDVGDLESREGDVADRLDLTVDGAALTYPSGGSAVDDIAHLLSLDLRGAPIQIGLMMLDPLTLQPVGVRSDFVGIVEGLPADVDTLQVTLSVLSQETLAHTRTPEVYMDVSHRQLHPGDTAFRFVSDTVRRLGRAIWNGTDSGPGGARGNGVFPGTVNFIGLIQLR